MKSRTEQVVIGSIALVVISRGQLFVSSRSVFHKKFKRLEKLYQERYQLLELEQKVKKNRQLFFLQLLVQNSHVFLFFIW